MAIAFRVDSSVDIGSGHIYRCLSLALQLRATRLPAPLLNIIFISKDSFGNFSHIARENRFQVYEISDQLNEKEDAEETLRILQKNHISTLVVDHYNLNLDFELLFKINHIKVMVIDDLIDRKHACDILLDQNFKRDYSQNSKDRAPEDAKLFQGPSYALLREEFYLKKLERAIEPIKEIKNVLVFFGGSDPTGETLRFLKESAYHSHLFHFHILVSLGNKFLDEIKNHSHPSHTLHINPHNIPSLMCQCDFYFGSGGSISWERMCLGLNGAIVIIAENQRLIAEELSAANLQYYWGWAQDFNYSDLIARLKKINNHELEIINQRTTSCMNLIDQKYINELLKEILNEKKS